MVTWSALPPLRCSCSARGLGEDFLLWPDTSCRVQRFRAKESLSRGEPSTKRGKYDSRSATSQPRASICPSRSIHLLSTSFWASLSYGGSPCVHNTQSLDGKLTNYNFCFITRWESFRTRFLQLSSCMPFACFPTVSVPFTSNKMHG
jgi:hypothetical protein